MNNNPEKENTSNIPETSTTKPMDSKRDVEKSPDAKTDQDFPGYPHYPAKEDIMDQRTGSHRVDADVENMGAGPNASGVSQRFTGENTSGVTSSAAQPNTGDDTDDDLSIEMGNDADVTSDDLVALNSTDAEIGTPQNVSNEDLNTDLDVPGSELDDADEERGEEDEENNYYSLGGDRHEAQEEDPQSGPDRVS